MLNTIKNKNKKVLMAFTQRILGRVKPLFSRAGSVAEHITTEVVGGIPFTQYGHIPEEVSSIFKSTLEGLADKYPEVATRLGGVHIGDESKNPVNKMIRGFAEAAHFDPGYIAGLGRSKKERILIDTPSILSQDLQRITGENPYESIITHEFGHSIHGPGEINKDLLGAVGNIYGVKPEVSAIAKEVGSSYASLSEKELMAEIFASAELQKDPRAIESVKRISSARKERMKYQQRNS